MLDFFDISIFHMKIFNTSYDYLQIIPMHHYSKAKQIVVRFIHEYFFVFVVIVRYTVPLSYYFIIPLAEFFDLFYDYMKVTRREKEASFAKRKYLA